MKNILLVAFMPLLLMNCVTTGYTGWISGSGGNITTVINTTTGQELIDLQLALDSGAITQEEYDELKLKIIERLDAPVDTTDTN